MRHGYKPKFHWRYWRWTRGHESLFDLDEDSWDWFKLFAEEANK